MSELPPALGTWLLCSLGFSLIALSQERHWEAVSGGRADTGRPAPWAFGAGLAMLLVGGALALASQGPSFGALLWTVALSAGAMAVALALSWWPRGLRPLWRLLRRGG